MTTVAVWSLWYVTGVVGTFIILWLATRLAWIKASGVQILGIAAAVQLVSTVPRVGSLLALVAFFLGLTRYLGTNTMEALYVVTLVLLVRFAIIFLLMAR